ncbi:MAG TPA: M56 family metallopeptidase [Blastocatellia bacterium]|nr:M56 family metallopeptidase [Blastocatellia bacterium]
MKSAIEGSVMIMEAGLSGLLIWSWQAAILIAGVWLMLKISRVQSAALRHRIWLLGLLAAAALPGWWFLVQVLPLPQPSSRALVEVAALPGIITGTGSAQPLPVASGSPQPSGAGAAASSLSVWALLFMAWMAGALTVLVRIIRDTRRLARLRREARPLTLEEIGCEDCRGVFSISCHDRITSPILTGIWRPSILLPADLTEWTTAAERQAMIQHEIAHLGRRDHFVNLFQTALGVIFYFHPLVIHACRQLKIEREMACDELVIDRGTKAEIYAESLLKAAERKVMSGMVPHLGMLSAKRMLERRIEMIMSRDRRHFVINQRRHLVLFTALISTLIWMLAPVRSAPAKPEGDRSTNSAITQGYLTLELTADQQEQIMQASEAISGLGRTYRVDVPTESVATPVSVTVASLGKVYNIVGYNRLKTPAGEVTEATPTSIQAGRVKNASPFSSRLQVKILAFDQPLTLTLTDEQRQSFYQTFHRSVTELEFEPAQDFRELSIEFSDFFPLRIIENLRNTFQPDTYWVGFNRQPGGELKMSLDAYYRNIHKAIGRYYPGFYPLQERK